MSHLLVIDVVTKIVHESKVSFIVKPVSSHKNHEWLYYFLKLHFIIREVQIFEFFVTKKLTKENLVSYENEKDFRETEQIKRLTYAESSEQLSENDLNKMQRVDDDVDIRKNKDVVVCFKALQEDCKISNIDYATEERRNHFDTFYRFSVDRQNLHRFECRRYTWSAKES